VSYKFGHYAFGSSVVHSLDPRMKIAAVMLASVAIFRADASMAAAITAIVAAVIVAARLSLTHLWVALKPPAIFFALIFLMHLFAADGEPVAAFPLITYEGLFQGALLTWRFVFLVLIATILTATTQTSTFISGLEWFLRPMKLFGISSHDLAVMAAMVLRFVPALLLEIDQIREAQIARGADFKTGAVAVKIKRISSLLIPLIRNSIVRAEEVALAMESRSYRPGEPRTYPIELRIAPSDYTAMAVLLILSGLWGLYQW